MSRLLVDDVTKTDSRALLNVSKMAIISDIVTPTNQYLYASGANELTLVENCVSFPLIPHTLQAGTPATAGRLEAFITGAAARWTEIYSPQTAAA